MADAADFDRQMAAQNARGEEILWHEVPNENILVEGLGFFAEERRWNRLPQSLSGMLQAQRPALIELSSHMAGACLRFRTDSRAVWVKAAVNAAPYMAHVTPAAQCGCDCYLRALPDMAWQFAGLTKFSPQEDSFCCELARDLPPHTEVLVYLPLYIGIRSIAIGLEKGAQMQPALPRKHRRTIAFYGTSITQGGCASRPGMAYPAILSRELDREVYNLGFSGNGVGMSGLASCFCSLPRLGALVVDIQPNAGPQGLLETNLPAFLDAVRGCAPQLPVLVLSASWQTKCGWNSTEAEQFAREERFQQQEVERRKSRGDRFIWFASARDMLETVKNFKFELKARIVPENFKIGLDNFIFTVLSSANAANENIDTVRSHIQGAMQAEVGLWEETDVKNVILSWILKKHDPRQYTQIYENPETNTNENIDIDGTDTTTGNTELAEQSIKEFSGDIDELKSILIAMLRDSPNISSLINKYFHSNK